jgi:hypothetical protein
MIDLEMDYYNIMAKVIELYLTSPHKLTREIHSARADMEDPVGSWRRGDGRLRTTIRVP